MAEFVRLCEAAELPEEGAAKEFAAGDRVLCVARVNGQISAMDNECPHHGGPLAEGTIEEGKMVCPWHAWAFDLHTGESTHSPQSRVEVYEIKVNGDTVYAKVGE